MACKPSEIVVDRTWCATWIWHGFPLERLYRRHELRGDEHQFEAERPCDFHKIRYLRVHCRTLNLRDMALSEPDFGAEVSLAQSCAVPRCDYRGDNRMESIGQEGHIY